MPTLLHGFIEPDLLTTPAKFGIIAITCFHNVLHPFELEVALGIILLLLSAILLAAMPHGRVGKTCALLVFACSTAIIFTYSLAGPLQQHLQHDNPSLPPPLMNKFPPPIHREHIVISNEDGYFHEASSHSKRIVLLRGVNFGSKTPREFPITAKILNREAFHTQRVSFLDRPCALKECGEHFARLRSWGFTVLRLLVTWESIEPNEPGVYDVAYLEFLQQFCSLAGEFGLSIIIDPHQDVWSRHTGGDGAPGWTLRVAGFNLSALHETNAAIVHHEALLRNESYPTMIWPTGYGKLAVATMFTLFFGGNDFAPNARVNGEQSIQDYLQQHYVEALQQVARVLRRERNVLGFDTMNEPNQGYIGLETLHRSIFPVPLGLHTSAFAGMMLGAGFAKRVNRFAPRPFVFAETVLTNAQHAVAWNSHDQDIWRNHGVWDIDAKGHPQLLRPGHFKLPAGSTFTQRYFVPFLRKLTAAIRSESHDYFIFAEPAISLLEEKQVLEQAPSEAFELLGGRFAWVPHMYDGGTLMTKSYHSWFALDAEWGSLVFGTRAARELFVRVGQTLKRSGMGWPVLVGETGVPMDMKNSAQALDRTLSGFERSFLSWTLWNYMPDNTKKYGDGWNGEDLSLFSEGKPRTDALRAAIRPYPLKLAGVPLETWFDMDTRMFFLKVRLFIHQHAQQQEALETEIFVPAIQYAKSISWRVGGRGSSFVKHAASSGDEQVLVWRHDVSPGATSVEPNELFVDQWIEIEAKK